MVIIFFSFPFNFTAYPHWFQKYQFWGLRNKRGLCNVKLVKKTKYSVSFFEEKQFVVEQKIVSLFHFLDSGAFNPTLETGNSVSTHGFAFRVFAPRQSWLI